METHGVTVRKRTIPANMCLTQVTEIANCQSSQSHDIVYCVNLFSLTVSLS